MFVFLLQLREFFNGQLAALVWFPIFSLIVWVTWGAKTVLSRRYRPVTAAHRTTTSVVVPVVDEPVELFVDVLRRMKKQRPTEIIVVINGPRNVALEEVCEEVGVTWVWTSTPGKRNAVRQGVLLAEGDIVVLVDSDTIWTDDTLTELVKPFADPKVGGVTTRQRILSPRRNFYTRWADWMENTRSLYSMPAQSTLGQVGCLPGRTIAFRRDILLRVLPQFMTQKFLGIFLEVSDDRTLTNLTLKEGYRTVYQSTSLVYTDAPVKLRKLSKQQLRWARGSQYNTLRMLPWMIGHAPVLALFFLVDILLPFLLIGTLFGWAWHSYTHTGVNLLQPILDAYPGAGGWALILGFIVIGSALSMWLRQLRHLLDEPRDWPWMPLYILFSTFFLMPLRLVGFIRMAHTAGWGTRRNAYRGERRSHLNPLAAVPYLLAAVIIGAEVALVTQLTVSHF